MLVHSVANIVVFGMLNTNVKCLLSFSDVDMFCKTFINFFSFPLIILISVDGYYQ